MKALSIALVLCFTAGITLAEGRGSYFVDAGRGIEEFGDKLSLGAHMNDVLDMFGEPEIRMDTGRYGPGFREMKEGEVCFIYLFRFDVLFDRHERVNCITVLSILYTSGDTRSQMSELYGEPEEREYLYHSDVRQSEEYHHYWTKGISFSLTYSGMGSRISVYYPIVLTAVESQTWGKVKALFR